METKGFSPEFFDALASHPWPGNVRELVNTLDGCLAVAGNDATLFTKHLPTHIRVQMARASVNRKQPDRGNSQDALPRLRDFRQSMERQYLKDLLCVTNQNIGMACQISGLSRSRLYELLSKHQIHISR
jgi:two-component system NtrC family response regulator